MTVEFLKGLGFKLCCDGRSVVTSTTTAPNTPFTDKELVDLVTIFSRDYHDPLSNRDPIPYRRVSVTPATPAHLPRDDVAYKFTDDVGVGYWLAGNIRLNPLHFYHTIENKEARDAREGLGTVFLQSPGGNFLTMDTLSGFNAFAICTSADARRSERQFRHLKFGRRLLRINRVREFTSKIARKIGASRFLIRDVHYSDTKVVRGTSQLPDIYIAKNGLGDLKESTLEYLAQYHVDELIELTEAASAFTKPNNFRLERERRLLFIMDKDVTNWQSVHDSELSEHIELIV